MEDSQILRVGNATKTQALSWAIYRYSEEGKAVTLSCIGMMAVYTSIKAAIMANKLAASAGYAFFLLPYFQQSPALRPQVEGEERVTVCIRLRKTPIGAGLWEEEHQGRRVPAEKGQWPSNFARHFLSTRPTSVEGFNLVEVARKSLT